MTAFGTYDKAGTGSNLEAGIYGAIISDVQIVKGDDGKPKETKDGKNQVDVWFTVDPENIPRRRFSISFGKNTATGKYSAFAEFLQATTGVKCGDKDQRKLCPDNVLGQMCRIVFKEGESGYMDVTDVLPPGKAAATPKAQPANRFVGGADDDEMTFPETK